ncbi:ATP-binding protein [Methylophaga sp.]|jgi:signal transduction histidine kinase/HAMP domain-containing protein|uniref:sensor histidine kinase n=1 Tax=Methylophaga sp. TaxID=2024840 RepID=UPI001400A9B5|nr:ATP-binding protein [Methylophaga sp.]MTI63450.1 HAMP domain-containing protein [Methylophaga sp.]
MKQRVTGSFRLKTLGLTFLLFMVFLLVVYFTSQKILVSSLSKQFLVQTESLTELIRTTLKPNVLSENLPAVNDGASSILAMEQVDYIQVYSYDKPLIELRSADYPERVFRADSNLMNARDGFFDVVYPFEVEGTTVGKALLSFSINEERALLLEASRKLATAAIVMTLIALLVTWILAGRIARRIQLLEHASNRFAAGDDDFVLPLEGNDEIASTGRAFEHMMWQIREKYEAINLSPDGILLVSSNKRITYTNPALISILGAGAKNLCGKPVREFEALLVSMLDKRVHADVKWLDSLIDLSDFRVHTPEFKILRCIRKQVESPDRQTFSEVYYLRDITHESEVDRMKSEFLTTAAHELRTPLASVMGFSELLIMNEYDQEKTRFVAETINRQSQNLKHLVDDLLDIARIEARSDGVLKLEKGSAATVVSECCELIAGGDKQCQLIYQPDETPWAPIWFDANKLKQALMNILSNAYKYSQEGGIVIVDTVLQQDQEDGADWFGIRVTDQGIGMNEEQLAHVGEKFYRADNAGAIPGTGLGMALTSEIISLHNGHMEITSQLGQGTQVTLWIPTADSKVELKAHG